ncbi:hypothetical protein CEP51_010085 [Fusarium floridanum]|uniref:Protein kinase domain-containing protein n=1 Tax=Fusarium floridanum TaxID=1325733 RepID=A0A428RFG8_9HYPO|nr:hypothetical protein CEP51_010085 [Fusarium floridanum]
MQAQSTIFDATAACRKSFVECQTFQVLAKAEWAENRLADFNLWASGIGASTRNRASLDARLALRPDARDVIVNLLRLLNALVEGCMVLAESDTTQSNTVQQQQEEEKEHRGRTHSPPQQTPPQRSFSPWSGDSNSDSQSDAPSDIASDTPLSEAMKNVDSILDQLARIAIIIRQSGTRSRLQKADRMLRLEEHQDLRDHLIAVVLSTGPFSSEHTFSSDQIDPNKLSTVQLRLINCNLKRRNRFLYAQRHSEALDASSHTRVPSGEVTDKGKAPEQPEPESRLQQEPEKPPKPVSAKPVDLLHNPSVKTGTSASGVTDLPLLPQNPVPSQAATTQLSTTVIKLDYPHPPEVNEGALVFRCPCCCRVLPSMMLDKNRWKKHLAEDLCPYTCILPSCPKPEILYITKEAWKAHLLEDHRNVKSWVCFACVDAVQFDEEDAFVTHTLQEHHDAISKDQIPTLKSICSRSVPAEISSCPLCPWPTEKDGEVDKGALIDHIAEEVHAFSLRSLPWGSDAATQETPPLTKAEKPPLPHYFDTNKYFAENMDGSSSSGTDSNDTMQRELKKLREEGPLVYSDSSDTQTRPMSSHTIGKQIRYKLLPISHDTLFLPRFLPQGDLDSILSEEVVCEIIAEALKTSETEAIEIRRKICGNRSEPRLIKVLATLILIEKVKYIRYFLDYNVYDDQLPLSPNYSEAVFQNWKQSYIESFCERQYVVLAPVFDFRTLNHYRFGPKIPMPFLERLDSQRGAHGTISRVRIHPDHQRWDPDSPPKYDTSVFAIKKFWDHTNFNQEREALERFSYPQKGHKHLIQLLLSYQLADEYFMVFPWAQGNLAEFWKKNPSNPTSRDDSYWFIKQCEGLASGLRKVHRDDSWPPRHDHIGDAFQADSRNLGRHGDIKPENILWFAEPGGSRGHLVVADFTLMRFHSVDSVEHTEARNVGFSATYCPPEVDEDSQTLVSQRYDTWTLGCVYLEFITWYLIGYEAIRGDSFKSPTGKCLESFDIVRLNDYKKHSVPSNRFFTPNDGSGANVKDSVKKWIRMLHGNQFCSQAMHDFLDLVENHMLVPVPNDRYSMDQVCAELTQISRDCQRNDYCHGGDPRLLSNNDGFPPEFTKQSTDYNLFQKMTNPASTSSLDSRVNLDLHVLEAAFADAIPTGHQPSMPISLGDAHPSRLGDQPTGDGQSKAGQHLSPPDT